MLNEYRVFDTSFEKGRRRPLERRIVVTGYRNVPVLGQGPIEHRVRARSIVHVIDLGPTSGRIDDITIPAEFYRMIRVLVPADP